MTEVLTTRALNRATLARQLLLRRSTRGPEAAVGHLGGLQSQAPEPPYVGLWARLEGFDPLELSDLLEARALVRATLQRSTIHLLRADDLVAWRQAFAPLAERFVASRPLRDRLSPLGGDLTEVAAVGRSLLHERPRTAKELAAELGGRWPDVDPAALAQAGRLLTPTVQVTPRGLWRRSGPPAFTTVDAWLGRPVDDHPDLDGLVRRYLGAFGPASVADAQVWSGLTGLGEVVARLRPELTTFVDEAGRELVDLPDAPRPPADARSPVRLLPAWDNLLLSHVDRSRVISDEHRRRIFTVNGIIHPTVLVDGFVAGTWRRAAPTRTEPATVTVEPFGRWSRTTARDATAEAHRLLEVTDPDADHRVALGDP